MKYSIVIPFYDKEGKITESCKNSLIKRLANQNFDKKEYEVVIVNDCSPYHLTDEDFKEYGDEFDVKLINLERNVGVGLARQVGIEQASGDYVMFVDNDDDLLANDVLEIIDKNIEKDTLILVGGFLEDTGKKNEQGKSMTIPHMKDKTWMHAKVYKRQWLLRKEIKFSPKIRYQEDGYFNTLAFALANEQVKYIDEILYVWKWNDNSITRKNEKEYNTKYFGDYIYSNRLALNNLKNRNKPELYLAILNLTIQTIGYSYYYLQKDCFKKENVRKSPQYKEAINQFKVLYEFYNGVYDVVTPQFFIDCMNSARASASISGQFLEHQTFKQFIKGLNLKSHKIFE